jgi:probable HAF family extracellular repeat protein
VVGYTITEGLPGSERGFLWHGGTLTELGPWRAAAINDGGQIAGTTTGFESPTYPVLWEFGQATELAVIPDSFENSATDINEQGQVVGEGSFASIREPNLPWYAFRYDSGVMVDLPTLGGKDAGALANNDAGWTVGYAETAAEESHAALWRDHVVTDLSVLLGDTVSRANAINNDGVVVGESYQGGQPFPSVRAFIWRENSAITDLGGLPNAYRTQAFDINTAGDVVGTSGFRGDTVGVEDGMRAFLYRKGAMTDLNDLIDPSSGWVLVEARAINDQGQIAGSGTTTGTLIPYDRRAFLLTPIDMPGHPVPTPQPPQPPTPPATPEEVATAALSALTRGDFTALSALYPPGAAPPGWDEFWQGRYFSGQADLTGCAGVSYTLGSWAGSGCRPSPRSTQVEVIAYFDQPCGEAAGRNVHTLTLSTRRVDEGWFLAGLLGVNGNAPEFGQPCVDDPGSADPGPEVSVPDELLGSWTGIGSQTNPTYEWPITITITGGPADSVVGTVAYPSLGCAGDLTLRRVGVLHVEGSLPVARVEVLETLTAGVGTCIDGGTFVLFLNEGSGLRFEWTSPDGQIAAEGLLSGGEASTQFTFGADEWRGGLYQGNGAWYGRPWVAVYGAFSEHPVAVLSFALDAAPSSESILTLTGLDDEFPANVTIAVSANGTQIYSGPSPFANWDGNMANQGADAAWMQATFVIPTTLLIAGTNELAVANLEPSSTVGAPPWVLLSDAMLEIGG